MAYILFLVSGNWQNQQQAKPIENINDYLSWKLRIPENLRSSSVSKQKAKYLLEKGKNYIDGLLRSQLSKMWLGCYAVFVGNQKNRIRSMVNSSNKEMEESFLMFHIATWGILLNRHEHMNLVALTPLIQYCTEGK